MPVAKKMLWEYNESKNSERTGGYIGRGDRCKEQNLFLYSKLLYLHSFYSLYSLCTTKVMCFNAGCKKKNALGIQ